MTPVDYVLIGIVGLLAATLVDVTARFLSNVSSALSKHQDQDLEVAREIRHSIESLRGEILGVLARRGAGVD